MSHIESFVIGVHHVSHTSSSKMAWKGIEKIRVCFKNIYYNHTAAVEQEHNEFLHVSRTSAARAQALALALASAAEAADDFA